MSTSRSAALDEHLKKQKPQISHLEYLDKILGNINAVHVEKVLEIRNTIELTLLDNPESKNQVVSYLSGVNDKLQEIGRVRGEKVRRESQASAYA